MLGLIRNTTIGGAVDEEYCLTDFGEGIVEYCKIRVENLSE